MAVTTQERLTPPEATPAEPVVHALRKRDGEDPRLVVELAAILGQEVEAVCGYRWVPRTQQIKGLPLCKACTDVLASYYLGEPA